jgi:type IV secretion system protein VirD4
MGRVGVITNAAAFLAGYNLRLLTVVQAMSQLDAVYGDKEARTFATNHGLQILYAPREQRDADEYSAMLGHFTERATSRGRSRSFSGHGHSTVSRNESEQRRALLLPQEFKELGSERLVVIFENCKPILGEKIRYYRDKASRRACCRHRRCRAWTWTCTWRACSSAGAMPTTSWAWATGLDLERWRTT